MKKHIKTLEIKLKHFDPKLREECGVVGISNTKDASALTALGLHALQHRGQEGCGIVSFDGKNYHSEKRQGLVGDHFTNTDIIKKLPSLRFSFSFFNTKDEVDYVIQSLSELQK